MLAFSGDYKALTVGKSSDCTIPLKKDRDTLIEQSETLIEQSLNIIYYNKAITLKRNTLIQQPARLLEV